MYLLLESTREEFCREIFFRWVKMKRSLLGYGDDPLTHTFFLT